MQGERPDKCLCLQVLHDQIVQFTDAGAAAGNAVVTFDRESMSLLAPRGRFDVEMYLSSLKLTGQVRCATLATVFCDTCSSRGQAIMCIAMLLLQLLC